MSETGRVIALVDLGNGDLDAAIIDGVWDCTDDDRLAYALRGMAVPSYARSVIATDCGRVIFSPLDRAAVVDRWLAALGVVR